MKIVSKKVFSTLSTGTMFSYYQPCVFEGLMIKRGTIKSTGDFYYTNLVADSNRDDFVTDFCEVMERGEDIEACYDVEQREGFHDDTQLYLVYTPDDVLLLITTLVESLRK